MDFKNLEGFEEIFTDGVLDPSLTSPRFQEGIKTYKKLTDRVYLLYDPPTADFDIVFIHGIGSDEFGCWTTPQGVLWPATFLPQDFPRARIMTVGYAHSLWNFKNEDSAKEEKPAAEKHATAELEEGKKDAPKGKSSFFDYIPDSLESKFGSFLGSEKKGKTPASREVTAAPAANDVPERVESPSNSMLHDLLINEKSVEGVAKDFDSRGHKRSSRSLQSFRRVGADIAVRLCSNEVNIGCRPVVFVTHSMGGLITKQMLVSLFRIVETSPSKVISDGDGSGTTLTTETIDALRSAARLLYSTSGVVFYGTPHFGSSLASVITGLQRYYQSLGGLTPTNVVTGLGDHNKEELTLLNDQFLEVVERAREYAPDGVEDATQRNAPLSVLSFGETQKLHGLVLIVEPESSNPCPHDSRFPFHLIDADHSGVNRPESKIFPSYSIFYGFLDRLQQRGCLGGSNARKWDNTSLRQIGVPDGAENTDETDLIGDAKWKEIFDSHYASFIGGKPARTAGIDRSDLYQAQHSTSSLFLLQQESEKSLQSLRYMLRSFFGHVIPSELDGLQSLGVDAREFIDNCTSMLASIKGSYMHVKDGTELAALNQKFDILNDRILTSFVLPFKLISYWIHHTIDVLTTLKRQQNERALSTLYAQSAGGGWVSTHLTSQEMKEFERIEGEVGVLTEEWEGFRRYINVLLRPFKYTSGASLSEVLQGMEESFWWRSLPGAADLRKENVDTLFFSHSIRCVMKTELREGDCLSALVNVYLKDALSREVQLDDMMGSGASSPAPLLDGTNSGDLPLASLLSEGLELFFSEADRQKKTSLQSLSVLPSKVRMQRVFPALASTSNFLLGFFVAIGEDREDLYSVSRKYFYESLKCVQAWSSQVQQIDKKTSATVQKMEKKWWDNSEQEKKMEQYRIQRRNSRLLSASFELMIHSFIMCTYIKEVTDLGGVSKLLKTPSENQTKAEWSDFGLRVDSVFRAAQKSYMSCEDVLCSGGAEDLERPFGSSAASPTTEASASPDSKEKGKKTLSAEESFIKTKQTFRETLDNLLKDLDSTDDGKTEEKSPANKETKTKKSSFWSSKSTSLPQFFLNSIVNAWDAVRRGGEVKETPEYFAKNVLVFWWSIERYWDILLHQESEGASALLKSRKSPAVDTFLDSTVPLLERKQRKYYDGCSINTKSQWMSAIGYHDLVKYWRELFSQPLTEGDPARTEALVRRLIPTSLYLSYDRSNALVHSLVGTFSIIRDGFTPDAAHPFHAVLQSEYSPDRALYRSSAVALGWIHLHHCFTSTALSISQSPFINKSVTSRSLLYDPIGVQSSPGPLLSLVESVINTVSSERTVDVTTAKWGELTKHHLNLAEDYFHMVLDHDPANIGALCGLGRLHMLATGHSYQPKLPTVADAFTPGAGSKGSIVGRFPQLDVARTYFETVLRSPPPPCVSASMPATEHMLDPIYRSFSAYWLSEMHKPFSWEDGGVTVPHFQHSMGGESGGNIFDEAFRSFLVSEEYLEQSVRLYPHNNWGLTSLGLHCLHRSQWKGDTSKLPAGEAERFQAYLEEQRHQGFSLLKRSLFLNPRNIWTIWGLSVFSDAAAEREKHQLELRRVFHRNLRTMKW